MIVFKLIHDHNCYYEKVGKNEPVKLEDLPFDIPDNWMWIRQKNICWLESGVKGSNENLPYLEAKVIRGKQEPQIINSGVVVDSSDRVILVDGENSGEVMIPPMRGYMGSTFKILSCTSFFDFDFLLLLFSYNKDKYKNSKTGAAIPHLNKDIFKESFIAVPPFFEQKRIVDKVSTINPLIKEYSLVENKLSALENNFPNLLKKSILQYAIEGKLVKQDPNDEPASVLLERIKAEKEQLIKDGKIKRDKNESIIYQGDDKNYYEKLPKGWSLSTIGNIGILTRGSGIKRSDTVKEGMPCIRYGELYTTYKTSFKVAASKTTKEIYDKSIKVTKNDILMSLTGENKEDISLGLAYLGDDCLAMGGDMICLSHHKMNPLFIVYVLNSPYGIKTKRAMATGDIIVHMSNEKISSIKIPIPPIAEQNRIVKKVNLLNQLI